MRYIARPIKPYMIDGNIDKDIWDNLIDLRDCVSGNKPLQATQFGVLGDGKNIYFGFRIEDTDYNPIRTIYNSKLYLEEVVEVFIAINNPKKYLEIEVSPNNTQFAAIINNKSRNKRQLKLLKRRLFQSRTIQQEYGWSVEIVLNIGKLCDKLNIRKDNISKIYFNAYRIDRPQDKPWELSALNPTGKEAFHCPDCFIELEA